MNFSIADISNICPEIIEPDTPLWMFKQNIEDLNILKTDKYTFSAQYQQNPSPAGGGMFKDEYWRYYDEHEFSLAEVDLMRIYGDTAQKTAEHNDWSVFQFWARVPNKGIYLLDQIRGKWEAPELESKLVEFWEKHKPNQFKIKGAQVVKIEDKSSGSSLIQSIRTNYLIPVEGIQRSKDKVVRAMGAVAYFHNQRIYLPRNATWLEDYKDEFRKFTPLMTHKHDDQIDPTVDAVEDLLAFSDMLYSDKNLGI